MQSLMLLKSQVVNRFAIKLGHRRFLPPTGSHTKTENNISQVTKDVQSIRNTHNEISIAIR
jgi:hypothetical protein